MQTEYPIAGPLLGVATFAATSSQATPGALRAVRRRERPAARAHAAMRPRASAIAMRILFCNYEYPPLGGGGGVANAALAAELASRHEVAVLTSRAFDLPPESIENGVRVVRAPVILRERRATATFASMLAYVVSGIAYGRRMLRAQRFDVINTHFALPTGPVGYLLARSFRIPNVLSVHGGDLYDPSKRSSAHHHAALRFCVRRIALAADAVVAQSYDTAANLRHFYAPEIEPAVIPLGIARPAAVRPNRAEYGFAPDEVLLITVGRLIKRKAIDQLIDAVATLARPNLRLLVVGTGPLEHELRAYAAARGVAAQIRFFGTVGERTKTELLALSDLFVSTSQHEGFGLVFVEAMAAELAVVCYATGGQTDFLEDGVTGHLVATGDRAEFAARCARLIDDPRRRAACGRENKRRAEGYFIDRCAQRYEALFESVLRGELGSLPHRSVAYAAEAPPPDTAPRAPE